jgi:hypothetical protein
VFTTICHRACVQIFYIILKDYTISKLGEFPCIAYSVYSKLPSLSWDHLLNTRIRSLHAVGKWTFAAVIMKSAVFWVLTHCRSERARILDGTYDLYLKAKKSNLNKKRVGNRQQTDCLMLFFMLVSYFSYSSTTKMETAYSFKKWLTFTRPEGVIS